MQVLGRGEATEDKKRVVGRAYLINSGNAYRKWSPPRLNFDSPSISHPGAE